MSFATITTAYSGKATPKGLGKKLQPAGKTEGVHTKEDFSRLKTDKPKARLDVTTGWEYYLNPLEYE